MRAVDIIDKKRRGLELSRDELKTLIDGYLDETIPDYQMSAWLMAVVWRGMTAEEMGHFTTLMASSGDELQLDEIPGVKVDKHSTGGVGDKTTLILGPLLASIGVPVAKMSGRGLGHTGGTIDKLESIPGFETALSKAAFVLQVKEIGVAVAGQTGDLAPADKRIYALRDVTATVQSIPLIASSIMSKKLASGATAIVLDVKVGDGAFMKTISDARTLAKTMVNIGQHAGRDTVAVLSSMEEPLGRAIGNALEVKEAIDTLQHQGPPDLTEICLTLGAEMAVLSNRYSTVDEARSELTKALDDGRALAKFRQFVVAQGGDGSIVDHPDVLPKAPVIKTYLSKKQGYINSLPALHFGEAAMRLGAGRATQDAKINPSVGLVLEVEVGDFVEVGTPLVTVHAADEQSATACLREMDDAFPIGDTPVRPSPLVLGHVRPDEDNQVANTLLERASVARENAYVPYSNFAVGAALQLADGRIVTGANIENASYGLTSCAERNAIFTTYSQRAQGMDFSEIDVTGIAVVAASPNPVSPCGACRQVLAEFCKPDTPVWLANLRGDVQQTSVGELLPGAFTPSQMEYASTKDKIGSRD